MNGFATIMVLRFYLIDIKNQNARQRLANCELILIIKNSRQRLENVYDFLLV